MATKLIVAAANWASKSVTCTFSVKVGDVELVATDRTKRIYELPANTQHVWIIAKPAKGSPFWQTTVELDVASNGVISASAGFGVSVNLTPATGAATGATVATVLVTRFREVTADVLKLLQVVPGAAGQGRLGGAPNKTELVNTYGAWPPGDLDIHPLNAVHVLDAANPVKTGGILNFAKTSVTVDAESIVVELAGVRGPRLFGVVWPKAVTRRDGAPPTRFFFYIRQTGGQDRKNVFVSGGVTGAYPYNFDYAERCLIESQHYSGTPIYSRRGWMLRPKGVPYQVASASANVVSIYPVADSNDSISYQALSNFDEMGRILEELQAFMFRRAGAAKPPSTVGSTALSAFSSANYTLASWMNNNRRSTFFKTNITAVYFLDPPGVSGAVNAGLAWRQGMGSDKRVRLYSARPKEKGDFPAFRRLLGLKANAPLGDGPFVLGAANNRITMAWMPTESWAATFSDAGVSVSFQWDYWDAHHLVPAAVLSHALAQGDLP